MRYAFERCCQCFRFVCRAFLTYLLKVGGFSRVPEVTEMSEPPEGEHSVGETLDAPNGLYIEQLTRSHIIFQCELS